MVRPDPIPRMPPLERADLTDDARAFLERWSGGFFKDADANPVLRTFAHHPKLADIISQLTVHLLTTNTLPVKQRQIAIMRTAWITGTVYMWSSHLNTSVLCGLDPDMYRPIQLGAQDPYFTPFERKVIIATEELVRDQRLSDANWGALSAEWNNQQMLDFLFTVGTYVAIAGVMNATRVQRQDDLLALAEKYGASSEAAHPPAGATDSI